MAKIIDKIVKSKNAPQSTNVLWDDGENLKIYRNGVWENTNSTEIKEGSIPLSALEAMPHAYPVEYYEGPEPKVVRLGGEKNYNYIGEISVPADMEVEGTLLADMCVETEYAYQFIYEGALQSEFRHEYEANYLNLYIGNDKYGYSSLKIEYSEDPNNLKWFDGYSFGMFQESPGNIQFAFNVKDYILHYRAYYLTPCNIKVYILTKAQKLDVNLIPNTVLKTTPQTLSDDDKNQALANLGIENYLKDRRNKCTLNLKIYKLSFDNENTNLVIDYAEGLDNLIKDIKSFIVNCVYYNEIGLLSVEFGKFTCIELYSSELNNIHSNNIDEFNIPEFHIVFGTTPDSEANYANKFEIWYHKEELFIKWFEL